MESRGVQSDDALGYDGAEPGGSDADSALPLPREIAAGPAATGTTCSTKDQRDDRGRAADGTGEVGVVLDVGTIAVGEGSIEILSLKPSGSASMTWKDFCNGRSIGIKADFC